MTLKFAVILTTVITTLILLAVQQTSQLQMSEPNFINGWIFLTFLLLLVLYYLRKKLNILPLGNMASWLSFHLICASGFIITYGFHIGATVPEGIFNLILWGSNLAVLLSGLLGWVLTRTLPKAIRQIDHRALPEDIPQIQRQLADEAEITTLNYLQTHYNEPLHRLFSTSIYPFLLSSPSLIAAITQGQAPFRRLMREIEALEHYVTDDEQTVLALLAQKVKHKYQLDKQAVRQAILRHWLYLHASSTVVLVVCIVLHIFAVYGFSMGAA